MHVRDFRHTKPAGAAGGKLRAEAKAAIAEAEAAEQKKQKATADRKRNIELQFSAWDGSHRKLERFIKDNLNDPDSYKHEETVYWDMGDHLVVRTTYFGRNLFGGTVKEHIKAKVSLEDGAILQVFE